jgi:hypothetical protein
MFAFSLPICSRKTLLTAILVSVTATVSGCAYLTTYTDKEALVGGAKGVFIDAKQRAVITSPYKRQSTKGTETVREAYLRFCAEPSPDALSALAANLGVSAKFKDKASLDLNQGLSEGAANIGVRTAAIQSLRDITYRDCEAFLNGGITRFGLETLQRRFQSTLVAVLAIEQLTGAIRAPSVALTAQSKGTDAESLVKLIGFSNSANADLAAAKSKEESATSAKDQTGKDRATAKDALAKTGVTADQAAAIQKQGDAATDDDKKKLASYLDAKSNVDGAQKKDDAAANVLKSAQDDTIKKQQNYDGLEAMRKAAAAGGGSNSVGVQFAPGSEPKPLDKESLAILAPTVQGIVDSTLRLGFGREVCVSLIGARIDPPGELRDATFTTTQFAKESPLGACIDLLQKDSLLADKQAESIAANTQLIQKVASVIESKSGSMTPEQLSKLISATQGLVDSASKAADKTPPALLKTQ